MAPSGLSIDSIYAHIAWLRTIKEKIEYKKFRMLQPNASTTQAVRAVFIMDPEAKVRGRLLKKKSQRHASVKNC